MLNISIYFNFINFSSCEIDYLKINEYNEYCSRDGSRLVYSSNNTNKISIRYQSTADLNLDLRGFKIYFEFSKLILKLFFFFLLKLYD